LQEIKAKRKLSQDFVNHLVAQTPQGEAGIGYIDQIGHMVRNAHQIRLPLSADHQKEAIGYLHGVRAEEEQDVILGVQNESSIRLVGLNLYKASILDASASGDKAAIRTISTKVKKHVDALGRRIDQLSQQPDSNIKKAKILALKQEQTTLITEIGMGLNQERSLDNIFRAVESFARATRGEQRALAAMARSNIMFTNYLADREIRQQEKEARQASAQAFDKQLDRFNKGWQGITNKIQSAYALSAGEAQTKRITEIANEAVPMLNKAVRAGTITRDSYKAYIERIGKQLENASELRTIKVKEKFFGMEIPWGEEQLQVRKLKGAERDKAVQKAQAQFGKVVESYKKEFDDMGTAYSYLNAWALGKHEKAVLTQYLDEKLPLVLGSKKFKSLPDSVQQDKVLAGLIRKSIESYRRGTLK
ncbi:MAG: hypothetical protein K8F91_26505, partial [Candidatus Obscuribacterales bacterium]|nr:hypothetical protein [Candidatus Obscuribacterales bacterium]